MLEISLKAPENVWVCYQIVLCRIKQRQTRPSLSLEAGAKPSGRKSWDHLIPWALWAQILAEVTPEKYLHLHVYTNLHPADT